MPVPQEGRPHPIGADRGPSGTNFAVYSETADAVEVCLLAPDGSEERVELPGRTGPIHHGCLPGVTTGDRYGLRIHGSWDPRRGRWFNPAKLLIDPMAHAIDGDIEWDPAVYGPLPDDPDRPDPTDSAPFVPPALVVDHGFDWEDDQPPGVPWTDTVIYETHVKSLTARHPEVPVDHRGRYLGLTAPPVIDHLVSLGVTAVELMPVSHFVHDHRLVHQGLRNLWGYQPIGFAAPHHGYATPGAPGAQVTELKRAVKTLHAAGIEVLLDVVFNHSGEGDHLGPNLSLRGIDNPTYYRLADDPGRYLDLTGVGNTLDTGHPAVARLVADSLRRWVEEYHVDGFRFDLATTVGRHPHRFDPTAPVLQILAQDPVLSRVKLIAEPWDLGEDGYRLGGFPPGWREWNDRYRSTIRDLCRPGSAAIGDLATRITGSSDLFAPSGLRPATTSINYITSHDGFTLADVVSYDHRHNESNGDENRDGHPDNRSWNGGVEGPTDDPGIEDLRNRRRRSMLTVLLVSQGVPMLLGGDELGRTQHGNNNAYCQDNEISWYDWDTFDPAHLELTRRLVAFRKRHPVLRHTGWLTGDLPSGAPGDVSWFTPNGAPMTDETWSHPGTPTLTIHLAATGETPVMVMINGHTDRVTFTFPDRADPGTWSPAIDTTGPGIPSPARFQPGDRLDVDPFGVMVHEGIRHEGIR